MLLVLANRKLFFRKCRKSMKKRVDKVRDDVVN